MASSTRLVCISGRTTVCVMSSNGDGGRPQLSGLLVIDSVNLIGHEPFEFDALSQHPIYKRIRLEHGGSDKSLAFPLLFTALRRICADAVFCVQTGYGLRIIGFRHQGRSPCHGALTVSLIGLAR
ncbi:hypothetical protein VTK56DRAFT_1637 [Thermocarpiscus australiensis]